VDATEIPRKLFHAELAIPVSPGPLTLVYPKWIPGYHAPVGDLNNIVGLKITANGTPVEWKRDNVDMFAFHLVVPDGTSFLRVALDVVAPTRPDSELGVATARLFVLEWNGVLVYPEGASTDDVRIRARIRLPRGWQFACALPTASQTDDVIEFSDVSLTMLVDSSLLSGTYFRTLKFSSDSKAPVFLAMAADSPQSLDITPEWNTRLQRVIQEAEALFGGHHYDQYRFLVALSDELGSEGIEHHQSSDNRLGARFFSDPNLRLINGYLLPHEYVHSWNGKYRRPVGLATRNFQQPQTGELLWIYEGLTRYLDWVLSARSGILTPQEARDYVALRAAWLANRSGRDWRTLQDTAISGQFLYFAPESWQSLRRPADYYNEPLFVWLEADTIIRRVTQGRKSLDDFCRMFLGGSDTSIEVKTYTLEDVIATLNSIASYNWRDFFNTRLNTTGIDHLSFDGLVASGWNLVYTDTIGSMQRAADKVNDTVEERFSLGFLVRQDGTIVDVVRDSAAWKAGLGPGMKMLAIDRIPWSARALIDAINADRSSTVPLEVRVQNGSLVFQTKIDDHRGARYPQLQRNTNPDLMSDILAPRIEPKAVQ
jgi:predicted metalloprotease with PDZ domain